MRLSRHCYDKPHRCPGWAGGGMKYAKISHCRAVDAFHPLMYQKRLWRWRFHRCSSCGTVAIPHVTRWLDPAWWGYQIWAWREDLRAWREDRR